MKSLNWIAEMKSLSWIGVAVLLTVSWQAQAAPGTILFQDYFERSNPGVVGNSPAPLVGAWVVTPVANIGTTNPIDCTGVTGNTGCAGIDSDVPPWNVATSPRANLTKSMFTRWNGVQVTSPAINLAVPAAQVTYWLRRGSDCFSEWPGNNQTGCTYTATITVTGNTSTSVSGITINGVQIMSAASTASTVQNTVAANIKAQINVAGSGYTATVNNNVVTITGANMNAFSALPIITQVGTMTLTPAFPTYTPNYGEEFEVQYLNSANTWVNLDKYPAEGPPGQAFRPTIELPSDALWSGFKIRFIQPSGSGSNGTGGGAPNVRGYDYWHIDDVVVTELAATSYTGSFCDNFEGALSRWTVTGFGDASIGSTYFQGGAHDLDLRWDAVTVTSKPTDMTTTTGNIQFWVKRGIGTAKVPNLSGSDFPETGKNLVVQYLTNTATWATLTTFAGGGTAGQIYCPVVGTNCPVATPATNSFAIPADANLAKFQMRFSFTGTGTGYDFDYWHVDDVCIGAVAQPTDLSMTIAPSVPTPGTTLAPGAAATITLTITNNGPNVEPGVITVTDILPAGLGLNGNTGSSWSNGSMLPGATNACTVVGQVVTCTRVGSLAVGASTILSLQIQANPSAAGSGLLNTATVAGQSSDTNLANNTANNYYSFVPAAFEAYETTTTPTTATSGRIFTKLVGTAFNLKVIAINAGAISTGYIKTATVDLIDGTLACVAGTAALTGVTVTPASYTYTTGAGNDNGVHAFTFTSTTAYPNARVRIRDNNNAVGCSSDNFAIRPITFTVTSVNATNAATSGTPAIKAGAAFDLSATSVTGYNGTPVIDTTQVIGSPNKGTLAGVFGVAAVGTGTATGASFTYSEVGNFGLSANAVYDSTFTAVDQSNDCVTTAGLNFSNTPDTNGKYGCSFGSAAIAQTTGSSGFGRFIPDHFETALNLVSGVPMPCPSNLPTGLSCPTLYNGFVYSGQAFTTQVTAKNAICPGGICGTTQNYAGSYAKAVTLSAWNGLGSATAPTAGSLSNITVAAAAFSSGVATTATPIYTLPAATVPTDIYIRATDTDSVTSLSATNPTTTSIEGGVMVVSGRMKISNAYGSELLQLPITVVAQYWNGTTYVTSVTDSVSRFVASNVVFGNYQKNLNATNYPNSGTTSVTPASVVFANGAASYRLAKPGAGNTGSVDMQINVLGYLPSITGRATFGVYKGANEFIYQREAY